MENQLNTQNTGLVKLGFDSKDGMDALLRAANLLAASTLVPVTYRNKLIDKQGTVTENPNGLANCAVALNMASRMGADPLLIMQNLHVIEGRPSWSSQFVIASINQCGRFSPLRFELTAPGEEKEVDYTYTEWVDRRPVEKKGTLKVRHQECIAWAIERETKQRIDGPTISIQMALNEGWIQKKGSKWRTMQEVMLRYRAASMFGKLYAPELLMGLQTAEESQDIQDAEIIQESLEPPRKAKKEEPAKIDWPENSVNKFGELMDEAFKIFVDNGMEAKWNLFENKWNPKFNIGDDFGVLRDLEKEINALNPEKTAGE
jgi:hypothetical protein